jgi:hypothetical protein
MFDFDFAKQTNSQLTKFQSEKTDVKPPGFDTISTMDTHAQLMSLRGTPGTDQNTLAPLEHRAFAREWTQENPWLAVPSLTAAIPLYTAAKALGFTNARSKPSLNEIRQGYAGIFDGLKALSRR